MKKFLSCMIACAIVLSCTMNVHAYEESFIEGVLEKAGLSMTEFKRLSDEDKEFVIDAVTNYPELISTEITTTKIDEFQELSVFVNSTDEELLEKGLSQETIDVNRTMVQKMLAMDANALAVYLERPIEEAITIQNLLTPGSPIAQYTIPENELTVKISVTAKPTSGKIDQLVIASFWWNKQPAFVGEDEFAIAWGGGLATEGDRGFIEYVTGEYNNKTMDKIVSLYEDPISVGLKLRISGDVIVSGFDQYYPKGGQIQTHLTKNNPTGEYSKVIGIYAHKVLAVTGVGIQIFAGFPSASIQIGVGFQESKQAKAEIRI